MTRCRGPSPRGIIHAVDPVFRLMAVRREYGGLNNGKPRGPRRPPEGPRRKLKSDPAGSGLTSCTIVGIVWDGTYSQPVSGSTAAPCQFAPPPAPGIKIVPFFPSPSTEGGSKRGPC